MPYRSLHDSVDFGMIPLETEPADEFSSLPVGADEVPSDKSTALSAVTASNLSFTHVPDRFSTSLFSSEEEARPTPTVSDDAGARSSRPPLNRAPSRFSTSLFAENFDSEPAQPVSHDDCYYGYDEDVPPTSATHTLEVETEDECDANKVQTSSTVPPVSGKGAVVRRRNNHGLSSSLHGGSSHSFRRSRTKSGLKSSVTRPSACLSSFVSVIEEFQNSKSESQNEVEALPDDHHQEGHQEASNSRRSRPGLLETPPAPMTYRSPPKCSHSKHFKSDEEPSPSSSPTKSSASQYVESFGTDTGNEHSLNIQHKKRHATSHRNLGGSLTSGAIVPSRSPPKRSSSMGGTNSPSEVSPVAPLAGTANETTGAPMNRSRSIGNGESMRHSDHGGDGGKRPSCPSPPCSSASPKGSNELDRATYHCSRTTSSSNRRLRESSKGGNRSGSRSRKASSSSLRESGTSDSSSDKPSRPSTFESPPSSRKSRRSSNKKTASYALELSNPVIWRSLNEIVRLDADDWKPAKNHDHHSGRDFRYCELNIVLQT
jgi:hypothetical protein